MTGPALAGGLALAAAPTFAAMALASTLLDKAGPVVCGVHAGPLGGMALMYLLMSAFHLGPWLRRASVRD